MKKDDMKKITALGVVIFSFIGIGICFAAIVLVDAITALLVLKTSLPESALKIGSVVGSGIGLIASTAFVTLKGRMRGIVATAIMAGIIIAVKILGNGMMNLGGYFNFTGLIGILFAVIFALIGGVLGTALKRR